MLTIAQLTDNLPQAGTVQWIGVRPARGATMQVVNEISVSQRDAIIGDRYRSAGGKRQVTLMQYEHLQAIASMLGVEEVAPQSLRRNIVVKGINLLALKGHRFQIGSAVLEFTGLCHPCSHMEKTFGIGGYNAVRGHGGITATVLIDGCIATGDTVKQLPAVITDASKAD